ncbi:hypothetical protein D3C87_1532380 [compost metagenome]
MPAQAPGDGEELSERGHISRGERRLHGGGCRVWRVEQKHRRQHEAEDQQRADDVGGAQCGDRPAIGARRAVEHVSERDHRQGEEAEEQGNDVVGLDAVAEQMQADEAGAGERAGRQHGEDARRDGQAADFVVLVARRILRQETDDGRVEAEAGEIAEHHDQHPDEDEDSVFELAHQPGLHDLGGEGNCRAQHADGEGNERHALGAGSGVVTRQRSHELAHDRP